MITVKDLRDLLEGHEEGMKIVMLQEHTMGECAPLLSIEEHSTTRTPWGYVSRGETGEVMLVLKGRT